tara:strand:+ start:40 stop:627 length:588 start_codon:yes stop_codon:yes gene_type:complete
MKTINIHGKQYVEVKERIKYFRENFKDWSLTSEVIDLTDDRCVIKATISNEKGRVIATGIAYESKGSSYINKTSFIENCETSAWGRALANIGIGLDVAIASADEVLNAKAHDKLKKPKIEKLSDAKFSAMIVAIGEGKGDTVRQRLCKYKISKKQQAKLDELMSDKKEKKTNGVLGIIDELNSIEVPTEIKNINN